jgi:hypothetical protein
MPLGLLPPPDIVGGTARETITVLLLHGEHPITGRRTLVLGRPDTDGQWLWRLDLQAEFPLSTTPAVVAAPAPGGISVDEPPVPLRLRDTAVTSGDQGQGRM